MRLDHLLSKEMGEVGVALLLICQGQVKTLLVVLLLGDTPVLIPNTMVKTQAADGTILETVWESRWLPDLFKKIAEKRLNKYWFYQ